MSVHETLNNFIRDFLKMNHASFTCIRYVVNRTYNQSVTYLLYNFWPPASIK